MKSEHDGIADAGPSRVPRAPAIVLAFGLIVTAFAGWGTAASVSRSRASAFDDLAHDARTGIQRRLAAYSEALFGLRSLFQTTPPVGRKEFHDFVRLSAIQDRLPGIQGLSFVRLVRERDVTAFEASVRADRGIDPAGYPSFSVQPRVRTDDHFVVEYIEPPTGNEPALGFDLASEAGRLAGIKEARDTGDLIATAPVHLIQDVGDPRGFLLFLAVYDTPSVPVTAPARRRHLVGLVDAVFRTKDLLQSVLGASRRVKIEEVFDVGPTVASAPMPLAAAGLLVDESKDISAMRSRSIPTPHRFLDIDVGSRRWRLLAIPSADPGSRAQLALPWIVAAAGLVLTALLAGLMLSIAESRAHALALAADMTSDLRRREHELELTNEQLVATNKAVREFVAIASHDMRSPLATVTGFTRVLREDWERITPNEREQYLAIMQRRGEDLARLVDDLFLTSEIEAGALKVRSETIALRAGFERIIAEFASRATIEAVDPDELRVRADPNHFARIITNYVDNAVKYGAAPFRVEARSNAGWVEIRVIDAGTGVPGSFVPRLFEKFARADAEGRTNLSGTGLGLSIVRGLARANGGEAWYEPVSPHGACFAIRLPPAS